MLHNKNKMLQKKKELNYIKTIFTQKLTIYSSDIFGKVNSSTRASSYNLYTFTFLRDKNFLVDFLCLRIFRSLTWRIRLRRRVK